MFPREHRHLPLHFQIIKIFKPADDGWHSSLLKEYLCVN
ncbi:hypothetical protein CSC18_3445 [Klebsiella aerogenes]|nr:hypothetical protein CSC18_3445 [Klebsiella aerogenes]